VPPVLTVPHGESWVHVWWGRVWVGGRTVGRGLGVAEGRGGG
jgi:hypothetical protein